jgi:hypothetical protein
MASDRSAGGIFGETKFRLALESNEPHVNMSVSLTCIPMFCNCTIRYLYTRIKDRHSVCMKYKDI